MRQAEQQVALNNIESHVEEALGMPLTRVEINETPVSEADPRWADWTVIKRFEVGGYRQAFVMAGVWEPATQTFDVMVFFDKEGYQVAPTDPSMSFATPSVEDARKNGFQGIVIPFVAKLLTKTQEQVDEFIARCDALNSPEGPRLGAERVPKRPPKTADTPQGEQ